MSSPTFPVTPSAAAQPGGVTLALTVVADPDNPITGDLDLRDGQLHFWDGATAKRQKIQACLQFILGEWFLNTEEGIPYLERVLVKNPRSSVITAIFRRALQQIPGVAHVTRIQLLPGSKPREAVLDWAVTLMDGETLAGNYRPFVLTGLPK